MRFSLLSKIAVLSLSSVALTVFILSFISYKGYNEVLVNYELKDLSYQNSRLTPIISSSLRELVRGVKYLSAMPAIRRIVMLKNKGKSGTKVYKKAIHDLQEEFAEYLKYHDDFLQMQLVGVGNKGKELIRVERRANEVVVVPESHLETRKSIKYFKETFKLHSSEVYISSIELNKNKGKLEQPYRPVVYAAVPIYSSYDVVFGVVVISLDFKKLFKKISSNVSSRFDLFITNELGQYIYHTDNKYNFSFEFKKSLKIQNSFPSLNLADSKKKSFIARHNDFVLDFVKVPISKIRENSFIGIGLSASKTEVLTTSRKMQNLNYLASVFILLLVVFFTYLLSKTLLKPLSQITEVVKKYGDSNSNFEINKLPENLDGEFGLLARTFKKMLEDVISRENGLREAKIQAESSLKVKYRFLATMSHEIRTPLNGMLSCTNLLLENIKTEEDQKLLGTISSCGDTLLAVINDILDFSKIESGKMELELHPFNVRTVVKEIIDILAVKATASGSALTCEVDESVPEWVNSDFARFRQIFLNLVSNAIKFTETKIEVLVTAKLKENQKYEIQVSVNDDGIGISEEAQSKVFDSFSQEDVSTTRKYGGSGLGLSIGKGLAEALGGKMWFSSREGLGSIFYFTIEAEVSNKDDIVNVTKETSINPNMAMEIPLTILMVEDNSVNQMVGKLIFRKLGYTVDMAANGIEAVEAIKIKDYDFILMDQHMPEMDGVEATKRIRKYLVGKVQPRIVALTASVFKEDRDRCFEAGMDAFLPKPLDINNLIEELKACRSHLHLVEKRESVLPSKQNVVNLVSPVDSSSFNYGMLNESFIGDEEILSELVSEFVAQVSEFMNRIKSLHSSFAYKELEVMAHTLKGQCESLYAKKAAGLAYLLEKGAREKGNRLNEPIDELVNELELLCHELSDRYINEEVA